MIYEQTSHYSADQFKAAIPWAEMEALGVLRRSIHQVHVAETRARHAAAIAREFIADARLVRSAAAMKEAVPIIRRLAVVEARAFFGVELETSAVVFIRDCEATSVVRIEFIADWWSIVAPGDSSYPLDGPVFDLVEAERDLGKVIIKALIIDSSKQARCLTTFENVMTGRDATSLLGNGSHSVASLAGLAICTTIGY